ncbi:MAG TPA: ABC transporter permease [Caulobacteraceae bacterium]|jgi:ABC-2 type transport system permease protein
MNGFLSRTFAVMVKEFTQLRRDRLTYAMILVMPVVQLLLFGYAINSDPKHLPTAVLVQDQGRFSRSILGALKATDYFDFQQVAHSPDELDRLIRDGKAQFAITIPADFTRRVVRHDKPQILVQADATDPSATGSALAALDALPEQALSHDLEGAIAPAPNNVAVPFEVVVQRSYNPENITSYNIVPGLLGVILSMTLVLMTSLAVTRERERGTMESLLATPVKPLEVMAGKLAPYVVVGLVQASVILIMARVLFDVPMAGGWGAFALGLLLFIIGSLALGFLISTVAKSQLQAMQMSFFYMMPSILLSGFMFPFAGMPVWARDIGTVIPVTHFLRIVRGSLLKGEGFDGSMGDLFALVLFVIAAIVLALSRYNSRLD